MVDKTLKEIQEGVMAFSDAFTPSKDSTPYRVMKWLVQVQLSINFSSLSGRAKVNGLEVVKQENLMQTTRSGLNNLQNDVYERIDRPLESTNYNLAAMKQSRNTQRQDEFTPRFKEANITRFDLKDEITRKKNDLQKIIQNHHSQYPDLSRKIQEGQNNQVEPILKLWEKGINEISTKIPIIETSIKLIENRAKGLQIETNQVIDVAGLRNVVNAMAEAEPVETPRPE